MLLLSLVYSSISAQWAVLMAGSRGYNNYRHQADVFNLYSILANRGFQKDHIITLAYNDIVDHELNPRKGEVYSRSDHDNVYPGSNAIDYQEKEATAENFLRVLNGDTKNGRALQSEEGDDVFIYYNDHGAPGLLCVPSNNGPELYADHLQKTIEEMSKNHKFRRLFFVIEACYSGSVAKNISIPNVLFLAAAGPTQSSYSADWDCDVDAFRTNEFTKHFVNYILQNPDSKIIDCVNVSQGTMRSHVCAYGDFKVSKAKLSDFLMEAKPIFYHDDETNSQVESNGEDNKKSFIAFLQRKASKTNGPERLELEILLEKERLRRKQSSQAFKNIANKFVSNGGKYLFDDTLDDINYQCYRTAVEGFRLFCGEVDEHEMPKLRVFGNLCKISNSTTLLTEIHEVCPQKLWENSQLFI